MPVPQKILDLIATFERNIEHHTAAPYKEAMLRQQFINPLFECLGWDMENRQGHAPDYQDVIHEDAIKIGGATKAPDYSFGIGKDRKFFVEAKKPSVKIKDDGESAYQLRRYAWTRKLPLSILTNFREFAVYDGRTKPHQADKASVARVRYLTLAELPAQWDDIAATFSKDAVLKGSFDKFADTAKAKRGTATVDAAFLAEIESWRLDLAKNLANRNPELSQRDLNYAVQVTIDRIIFLRMCEDRGIEEYGRLRTLTDGHDIYDGLIELFRHADRRYNSGLFYFKRDTEHADGQPDTLTPGLTIDDKPLKEIIGSLYYPDCPYEFSVLPAEILGQVYEQFLGKVIRLTAGHQAKVEDKPEVKKAGGVYYTPKYIVDYIVKHTVGKLLGEPAGDPQAGGPAAGLDPKAAAKLRILDPACGSGSFLLGAYQYLLDWHRGWYEAHNPEKHAKAIYRTPGGWRLTTGEKKRILVNNIFGVDIDPQAVEVTKLSLLLKVLEGESKDSLERNLFAHHERALPDLASNIKCGNSLIGPDFYDGRQRELYDEDERYRINDFDWNVSFRAITADGGFDAVIGNPPYRRELDYKHLMDEIASTKFGRKYRAPRMDLWYYFVHRGFELMNGSAHLSFITNAYWTAGTGAEKLIAALRDDAHLEEIFFLGKLKVFQKVSGQHLILRAAKKRQSSPTRVIFPAATVTGSSAEPFVSGAAPVLTFEKTADELFRHGKVDLERVAGDFLEKMEKWPPLSDFGIVRQGIAENPACVNRKTNDRFGDAWTVGEGVFVLQPHEVNALQFPRREKELLRPYHDLRDLARYWIATTPSVTLIYSTPRTCPDINEYPVMKLHLAKFRRIMEQRRETRRRVNRWWHLHWPRDEAIWRSPKVVALQMASRPAFVASPGTAYVPFSVNVFVPSADRHEHLSYFTGLLNSRALWKWYTHNAKRRGVALEINGNVLARTPVRAVDFANSSDKFRHDRMVELVDRMLALHQQLAKAKSPNDQATVQAQIAATDRQIDQLVYELYGLTEAEIRIVEEGTAK